MIFTSENLEKFFPFYLTEDGQTSLKKGIATFERFGVKQPLASKEVTDKFIDNMLQGDIWRNFEIYDHRSNKVLGKLTGIVVSNSCDVDASNRRDSPVRVTFCPLISLENYRSLLEKSIPEQRIKDKISEIQKQKVTSVFYIPKCQMIREDLVANLDDLHSIEISHLERVGAVKHCSLNDFGFYLYLFKLSVHFCRAHENIDRASA